jgi:hypothetical protein
MRNNLHIYPSGRSFMVCQKEKYVQEAQGGGEVTAEQKIELVRQGWTSPNPPPSAPVGVEAFDAAVSAELPRVSTLEYNSHEICKHFAGEVRKRLAQPQEGA